MDYNSSSYTMPYSHAVVQCYTASSGCSGDADIEVDSIEECCRNSLGVSFLPSKDSDYCQSCVGKKE